MANRSKQQKKPRRNKNNSQLVGLLLLAASIVAGAFIIRGPSQIDTTSQANINETIVAEFDTLTVPVPVNVVEAGSKVGNIELKEVKYPRHQVPEGALLDLDGLEAATVLAKLPANLPIFASNISLGELGGNAVIDRIPQGMRAITIRVDATTVVEGWAGSGAIVDVLLVENDRTTVVAERVKILSTERSIQPIANEASPEIPSTVTLLVTQEQALAINTALPRGRLTFALRSLRDESGWKNRIFTSERFKRGESSSKTVSVQGYISVGKKHAYTLADGKWIETKTKPVGFRLKTPEEESS